jgi:hypothetical protein
MKTRWQTFARFMQLHTQEHTHPGADSVVGCRWAGEGTITDRRKLNYFEESLSHCMLVKLTPEKLSLRVPELSPVSIIQPLLQFLISFMYHRRYMFKISFLCIADSAEEGIFLLFFH